MGPSSNPVILALVAVVIVIVGVAIHESIEKNKLAKAILEDKEKIQNCRREIEAAEGKAALFNEMVLKDGMNEENRKAAQKHQVLIKPESLVAVFDDEFQRIASMLLSKCNTTWPRIKILEIWHNTDNPSHEIHLKYKDKVKSELESSIDQFQEKYYYYLWHGSTIGAIKSICWRGFSRSFSGAHGNRYGDGSYFAIDPSYCIENKFSRPDENGVYHIILAKVVVGRSCLGEKGMKLLPLGFHSAVDHLESPEMYIVFHDWAAHPDYVISFKL